MHLFCFCFFSKFIDVYRKIVLFFFLFSFNFFAVLKEDDAGFAGENGLYPPAIRL